LDAVERRLATLDVSAGTRAYATAGSDSRLGVAARSLDGGGSRVPEEQEPLAESADVSGDGALTVQLEGTVWDCAILIGIRGPNGAFLLSRVISAAILCALTINVSLQLVCAMALPLIAQDPLRADVKQALLLQRFNDNHAIDHVDKIAMRSKANELCTQTVYNSMGNIYQDVADYLGDFPPNGPYWPFPKGHLGVAVSASAMLIWIFTCTAEFLRILKLQHGIMSLQSVGATQAKAGAHAVMNAEGEGFSIVKMSRLHKTYITLFIQLPRLAIEVMLLGYGLDWLAETVAVSDMILNACALEIVSNIDETLFSALLQYFVQPSNFCVEAEHPAEKAYIRSRSSRQLALILLPLVFILVPFCGKAWPELTRFHESVKYSHEIMCGGDMNFAYGYHGVAGLPIFASLVKEEMEGMEKKGIMVQVQPLLPSCVFETGREMLLVRGNISIEPRFEDDLKLKDKIEPKYLKDETIQAKIRGTHSSCSTKPITAMACPVTSVSVTENLDVSMAGFEWRELNSVFCLDQPVYIEALTQVCSSGNSTHGFRHSDDYPVAFMNRSTCEDFADLCACPMREQHHDICSCHDHEEKDYANLIKRHNITYRWIRVIQRFCPVSCGVCETHMEDNHKCV
jgi:hypothetical protein